MDRRKRLLLGTAVCLASLVGASSAFAAGNTINLTRFSKTVSGNTGTATYAGTVTVDLLRNTPNAEDVPQRAVVDTCTATASAGAWSCSFPTHAFTVGEDLVEVDYGAGTGAPATTTVVVGDGRSTLPASATVADVALGDGIDGNFGISADGTTLREFGCGCGTSFTATVDGATPLTPTGSTITFSPAVTDANNVQITGAFTGGGTTVHLTDEAPLLGVAPADYTQTTSYNASKENPGCTFYLVTSEDVCQNLEPGTFTVKQVRGGQTVSTLAFNVPAQTGANVPSKGGVRLASVAPGDQLQLLVGSRVVATVTVAGLLVHWASVLVDPDNGSQNAVSGNCTTGEFFTDTDVLCGSGAIPPTLNNDGPDLAQLDDTGGTTEVDFPDLALNAPSFNEFVHTPATAIAVVRSEDPLANALADDASPLVGQGVTTATIPSSAQALFSYRPLGAAVFTTPVNANTATGAPIASLPAGAYVARWEVVDGRGDTDSFDSQFISSAGGPTVKCTAVRGTDGVKATIASKHHSSRKSSSSSATLKVTCSPSQSGARVAVWLVNGNHSTVASGSGTAHGTSVTITLTGTFKKGTYALVETADLNGQSTESTQIVTIKSGPKAPPKKHKKHKKHKK